MTTTIQKTAKWIKLMIALGGVAAFFGLLAAINTDGWERVVALLVGLGGLLSWLFGKIAKWFCHS